MASFKINFQTNTNSYDSNTPLYKVKISTSLLDEEQKSNLDGFLLIIERNDDANGIVDTFYGIAKPTDFKTIGKRKPNKTQKLYRTDNWNLVFYNEKTMNDALTLMRSQVDLLALGVAAMISEENLRSSTHVSPSF
jgi:hypothetical protein